MTEKLYRTCFRHKGENDWSMQEFENKGENDEFAKTLPVMGFEQTHIIKQFYNRMMEDWFAYSNEDPDPRNIVCLPPLAMKNINLNQRKKSPKRW